jgi:hypothetical protein
MCTYAHTAFELHHGNGHYIMLKQLLLLDMNIEWKSYNFISRSIMIKQLLLLILAAHLAQGVEEELCWEKCFKVRACIGM